MASHTACIAEASSHAKNIKEDTAPVTANLEEHPTPLQDSDRLESQSQPVPDNTDHSVYQDTKQPREEYPNNYRPQLEDIPELEDDEKNWEEGQFSSLFPLGGHAHLVKVSYFATGLTLCIHCCTLLPWVVFVFPTSHALSLYI